MLIANLKKIVDSISTIDAQEKRELLKLLKKYEHQFNGTLGNWETSDMKLDLKEYAKPSHGKAYPVPKNHHSILKTEIDGLVQL
jgi:hypothetical protein